MEENENHKLEKCPVCGALLIHREGCIECPKCGWSACDFG